MKYYKNIINKIFINGLKIILSLFFIQMEKIMEEIIEQIIIDLFQWERSPALITYETLEDYLDSTEMNNLVEEDYYEIEFEDWGKVYCTVKTNYYNRPYIKLQWLN